MRWLYHTIVYFITRDNKFIILERTIAITGASGHIGNVLCRLCIAQGWKIKALYHHYSRSLEGLPLELIKGDVMRKEDLLQLFTGCEVVINGAAIISIHGDPTGKVFTTNTIGPKNVLEASAAMGVRRIIHISSTHAVMETPHSQPYDETRPYKSNKHFAYDFSKAQGEQIMLHTDVPNKPEIVIIRPSSVLGPFDFKPSEMGKALLDFYHRKIPLLPAGGYNMVDVRDVAQTIVSAIDRGKAGEIYLVPGKYYTMKELSLAIEKTTGIRTPKKVLSYQLLRRMLPLVTAYAKLMGAAPLYSRESIDALRNGHPGMDGSKAIHELQHHCRPLEESLRDFYSWQKQRQNL